MAKSRPPPAGRVAAAFQDVAQHDHSQTGAAQKQTQAAQNLKGIEVSVLHGVEGVEAIGCRRQLQPARTQTARQGRLDGCGAGWRRVHEKHAIAGFAREMANQARLGHY